MTGGSWKGVYTDLNIGGKGGSLGRLSGDSSIAGSSTSTTRETREAKVKSPRRLTLRRRPKTALDVADKFAMTVRLLGYLVRDGYAPSSAIEIIARQTDGELGEALKEISKNVQMGDSLSDAIRGSDFFPSEFSGIVMAGERSGHLPDALDEYGFYLEKVINMKQSFLSALRYPSFMLSFIACMGVFILIGITPKIMEMAKSLNVDVSTLPLVSRILFWVYPVISAYGDAVPITLALAFAYYMFLGKGRAHITALISLIPQVRNINTKLSWSQWMLLMAICIKSGMSIPDSLMSAEEVTPKEFQKKTHTLNDVVSSVRAGQPLSVELEGVNAPSPIAEMVGISERTGRVDDVMESLARQYLFQLEFEIKSASSVVEPIVVAAATAIGGGIAGVVAITILHISSVGGGY